MRFEELLNNGFLYNIYQNLIVYKNREQASGFFDLPQTQRCNFRVLDIGCGPGTRVNYFYDTNYYGFDFNEQNIKMAMKKYKNYSNLHFICADINDYFNLQNFSESDYFDLAIMHGVLHHLNDKEVADVVCSVKKLLRLNDCKTGELRIFEPVILPQNSAITAFLLNHDRGKFIRTKDDYISFLKPHFSNIEAKIFTDIYRLPIPSAFIRAKL